MTFACDIDVGIPSVIGSFKRLSIHAGYQLKVLESVFSYVPEKPRKSCSNVPPGMRSCGTWLYTLHQIR